MDLKLRKSKVTRRGQGLGHMKFAVCNPLKRYPFWPYLRKHWVRYVVGLVSLIVVDAINVSLPLLVRDAVDAIAPKDYRRVVWAGVLYGVMMLGQAVGRYLWRWYLIGSSFLVATELRSDLYRHLQKLPLKYYQKTRTGDLMSRATNDIESIRMAVGPGILITVDAALVFLMIVPVMFWLSVKLSLLAFAFYPLVPWITIKLGDRIDALFESLQSKLSNMSAFAQESFSGIRLIKSLVLEPRVESRFWNLSKAYEKEAIVLAKYQAVFSPSLTFLTGLGTLLILMAGGMDVIHGVITVGTFIAFQRYVVQLSWPMEAIGWAVTMTKEGVAAHRRLEQVMSAPQVTSVAAPFAPIRQNRDADELLAIQDLSYRFDEGKGEQNFVLNIPSLQIHQGQKIGLVGPVGSGKSTLFQLILRLYEPAEGNIFFKGRDVLSIPSEELRQQIASVEQQIFLFSEDINSNIVMGIAGKVSASEIERASTVASIQGEILELTKGFETRLGERGVNLSGGQKQRLALMRALVREPSLLILDDSFSAVDVDIENQIIENFFALYPQLSVCFASHRLSIMPRMDEIWLIDAGKIIDTGHHKELLQRSSLYRLLWEKSERMIESAGFEPVAEVEVNK